MSFLRSACVAAALSAGVLFGVGSARADVLFDNSAFVGDAPLNIYNWISADDFNIAEASTVTGIVGYLIDNETETEGALNDFSGTLAWALYDDGGLSPGEVIASGTAADLVLTDTTQNDGAGSDIFTVEFGIGSHALGAGEYWLAIRENSLAGPQDNTQLYWARSANEYGVRAVSDTSPGNDNTGWTSGTRDAAFSVMGVVPEPGAVGLLALGAVGLLRRRAR